MHLHWQADGGRPQIRFSRPVLEKIRFEASRAVNGRVSLGLGGVLLGSRPDGTLAVDDWRPIACDHSRGPAFQLSASDLSTLSGLLESLKAQAPGGLEIVGWFVARPDENLEPSDAEIELHNRLFGPRQCLLVLHPDQLGRLEVAVHIPSQRSARGMRRLEPLLSVDPQSARRAARVRRQTRVAEQMAPEPAADSAETPAAVAAPPPVAAPRQARLMPVIWCLTVLALACIGASAYLAWSRSVVPAAASPGPSQPIELVSLQAEMRDTRLEVHWRGDAPAIVQAAHVTLFVVTGGRTIRRDLSTRDARSGVQFYPPSIDEVDVRMQVRSADGALLEEKVHLKATRSHTGAVNPPPATAQPDSPAVPAA